MAKLKASQIKNMEPGRHSDGQGLILQVSKTGRKSWIYRFQLAGKRRDLGLGSYPEVSLADARAAAADARKLVKAGTDPIQHRRESMRHQEGVTFERAAISCWEAKRPEWRSEQNAREWIGSIQRHALPKIGSKPVSEIGTADILAVLEHPWRESPTVAVRLRGRLEQVLDFARVKGWRDEGANPARWRGHLQHLLPDPKAIRAVEHHPAMSWRDAAGFFNELQTCNRVSAKALAMIMLTAGRCAEVVGMCWGEIDTDAATWTVPRERMKSGREHRVPLSPQAMQLLDSIPRTSNPFVFPGQSPGSHVSGVSVRRVLHEYFRRTETVHGFRACFRQWAAECCPSFPREAAERALAHVVGSEVERAYMRSDLFEIRRQLMQAWADYLTGRPYQTAPTLGQQQPDTAGLARRLAELPEAERQRLLAMLDGK